jgi:hypothetical protein
VVTSLHGAAVKAWQETSYDTCEAAHFWELALELDDETLENAARGIVNKARSCDLTDAQATCVVLLQILRTRLTGVRGNYLWPEVARELGDLASQPLDGPRCGVFFRRVIEWCHGDQLGTVHNRFVHFALDEAGVGKDRTAIVSDFLDSLLDHFLDDPSGGDIDGRVADHLEQYLGHRANREDVEALRRVLQRSGAALLRLAGDLQENGAGVECALWDWASLRDYWLQRSGVDLARILPEAREIFGRLLRRLADTLTRHGLAVLLAENRVRVVFPSVLQQDAGIQSPAALPLTPVRLIHGKAARDVVVRDDLGLTAEGIRTLAPNVWHRRGVNGVFLWRPKPFVVRVSPWHSEPSVPLVVGHRLEEAQVAGTYWSGTLAGGVLPFVEGTPSCPEGEPRLLVAHSWRLEVGGLTLAIHGFRAHFLDFAGEAYLAINGRAIWRGQLREGQMLEPLARPLRVEQCQVLDHALDISLRAVRGKELCRTVLNNPAEHAFLSLNGVVKPRRSWFDLPTVAKRVEWPLGILVVARSGRRVEVTGGRAEEAEAGTGWTGFSVVRIVPAGSSDVRVRVVHQQWNLRAGGALHLVAESSPRLTLSGAEVQGFDGVIPVAATDPLNVVLRGWRTPGDSDQDSAVLRLSTETTWYRQRLRPLADEVRLPDDRGAGVVLSVAALAQRNGWRMPLGPVVVELESTRGGQESRVVFFRMGDRAESPPCRLGERPCLVFWAGGEQLLRLSANHPVRLTDLSGGERMSGYVPLADHASLTAAWHPVVEDAVLLVRGKQVEDGGVLDLTTLGADWRLQVLDGKPAAWSVRAGELEWPVPAGGAVEAELLRAAAGVSGTLSLPVTVARAGKVIRNWTVDLTPRNVDATFDWLRDEGSANSLALHARVSWFGLPSQKAELRLKAGQAQLSTTCAVIPGPADKPGSREAKARYALFTSELALLRENVPLHLELFCEGVYVTRLPVPPPSYEPPPDSVSSPHDLKAEVQGLLARGISVAEQDDLALERVLYLSELYLRLTGRLPLRLDIMRRKIGDRGTPAGRDSVDQGLVLLDGLARDDHAREIEWPSRRRGRLGLFLLTLHALREIRLAQSGEARPSYLDGLAAEFSAAAGEKMPAADRSWAEVLAVYCRQAAAEIRGEPLPPHVDVVTTMAAAADHMTIGIDQRLREWLENAYSGSKGR